MKTLFSRSGKLPMIAIILAAVLLVVIAIGGVVIMKLSKKGKSAEKKPVVLTPWKFDDMLVTLNDPGELHYLKISLVAEMEAKGDAPAAKGGEEGGDDPEKPKALDVLNTVLSNKTLASLQPEKGKKKLKEELVNRLNSKLEHWKVHELYFTYFALQ